METKNNLPNIPIYIGDWIKDCGDLSLESEAAWLRIVFKMFTNGKQSTYKIPTKSLQNIWRCSEEKVISIIQELKDFNICDLEIDGRYTSFTSRRYKKENKISQIRREAVSERNDRKKTDTKDLQTDLQSTYKTSTNTLQNTENEIENIYNSHLGIEDNISTINSSSKEEKKVRKKVQKEFVPPTLYEFKKYFADNDFPEELAERAWKGYDVAEWHDSQGRQVKNWKQKCQQVWFTEQNRRTYAKQQPTPETPKTSKVETVIQVNNLVKEMIQFSEGGAK